MRTIEHMTQPLKKFPCLESMMFKGGLFICKTSKPLPIKKYYNQWMKCLRKDSPFAGGFTYLVVFAADLQKKLQIETMSRGLCGYLMVAQRLLSVARTSVRLRSSRAHLGEACEMRFSSAQFASWSPENARKGIWSLGGSRDTDLNSESLPNPSYLKLEQVISSLGTYKQVDVLESFGVCHIRVFLRSPEP